MSCKRFLTNTLLVGVLGAGSIAYADDAENISQLRQELEEIKAIYDAKIRELETRLEAAEEGQVARQEPVDLGGRTVRDNTFNPSIGLILNGAYREFSSGTSEVAGFAVGEDGERDAGGVGTEHTEFNFSANVDDKFFGSTTFAIAEHGGTTEVELEEAYLSALPGAGLPDGMGIKFGRALWAIGYLNEQHAHTDDFADRPLPYRVFMDHSYNDDGLQFTQLLPTGDLFTEIGGGVFKGQDFPFGSSAGTGIGAHSYFVRSGGDIGLNQTWRVGAYRLSGETGPSGRISNETNLTFVGDVKFNVFDLRYTWAPTGNERDKEVTFTAERFSRGESGTYADGENSISATNYAGSASGWYSQLTYKFNPRMRVGARYGELEISTPPSGLSGSLVDSSGHKPTSISLMADWTNSEFSRIRLQYNKEELTAGTIDHQWMLQYVMSLGAHGAHKY